MTGLYHGDSPAPTFGGAAIQVICILRAVGNGYDFWKHGPRYWRVERESLRRAHQKENRT